MALINALLLLIAFICFCAATGNATSRFNLLGAGLAAWVLVFLIAALKALG